MGGPALSQKSRLFLKNVCRISKAASYPLDGDFSKFLFAPLPRTIIKNAKRRGKKISLHLLLQSEQGKMAGNGAGQQKKQQIFFRLTAFAGRAGRRLVFNFENSSKVSPMMT